MTILNDLRNYFFHNKRKKMVIDAPMQTQLAVEILLHVVIFFILVILILYAEPFSTLFSSHPADVHQNAVEWLVSLNLPKWPLFVAVGVVVGIVSVTMSHRLAGSFYKVRKVLDSFAARDLRPRMSLRKHDYFQSVVPVVNEVRSTVAGDLIELKRDLDALRTAAASVPPERREEILQILNRASENLARYSIEENPGVESA
jgi:hypothetical protein